MTNSSKTSTAHSGSLMTSAISVQALIAAILHVDLSSYRHVLSIFANCKTIGTSENVYMYVDKDSIANILMPVLSNSSSLKNFRKLSGNKYALFP